MYALRVCGRYVRCEIPLYDFNPTEDEMKKRVETRIYRKSLADVDGFFSSSLNYKKILAHALPYTFFSGGTRDNDN